MDVFLLSIVSSFVLFAVLLPLFGVCLGLFCYYVLLYLFGGLVAAILLVLTGVKILVALWAWCLVLLWASSVVFVEMRFRHMGEEIEHYHAAHTILLFGGPYRRKRSELREAFAGEGEV